MSNRSIVLVVVVVVLVLLLAQSVRAQAPADPSGELMKADDLSPSQGVYDLAHAIAIAEGFGVAGALPTRANNPGDLEIPGWTGGTLGAQGISVFASVADGWHHLYHQLNLIRAGKSAFYHLGMTFADLGVTYTNVREGADWTANVVEALQGAGYGVTPESALSEVLG